MFQSRVTFCAGSVDEDVEVGFSSIHAYRRLCEREHFRVQLPGSIKSARSDARNRQTVAG